MEEFIQRWLQMHFEFRCRDCAGKMALRSRPRTFSERYILPVLFLQPVRCERCFRRDYRVIFTAVSLSFPAPAKEVVTAKRAA